MVSKFENVDWNLADEAGKIGSWERVGIAVLIDIRRELRKLNGLLACDNFISIPRVLRQIRANTTKRKPFVPGRKKKAKRG